MLLAVAGVFGVLSRWALAKFISWPDGFPYATLLINLLGSLAIGIVWALALSRRIPREWVSILCVGFLGGFTTFSAFSLESVLLWENRQFTAAAAYVVLAPIFGVLLAFAGMRLGQWVWP
ncbi:MAG: fluoride efflux transporter CrcB [Deltaproteobacteria bacterium]|nr:fluoride efflux transporter CrcB [Deltaproteobacteria bacterium]MBI3293341.1 fluoride efflux transporter CrcB [Deltaproteobacteria bacterium]